MKSMEKEGPEKFQNENWLVGEPKSRCILGRPRGQFMDLLSQVNFSTGSYCLLKQCRVVIYVYKHYVWECVFWYHNQIIEVYSTYWLLSTYRKLVSWGIKQSENEACHFSPFRMLYLPFPSINNSHGIVVRNSIQRIFKNFCLFAKSSYRFCHVRLSAIISAATPGRITKKFWFNLNKNPSRNSQDWSKSDKNIGHFTWSMF